LQHGSIRLEPDADLFTQVFDESFTLVQPFTQQREILIQTVIEALTSAAINCFSIQLTVQPLSESEWQTIFAQYKFDVNLQILK
jgi:lipoate-protein ligase A